MQGVLCNHCFYIFDSLETLIFINKFVPNFSLKVVVKVANIIYLHSFQCLWPKLEVSAQWYNNTSLLPVFWHDQGRMMRFFNDPIIVHFEKVIFPLYPVNSQSFSVFCKICYTCLANCFFYFFQFQLFDYIEEVLFSVMHIKASFLQFIDDTCKILVSL